MTSEADTNSDSLLQPFPPAVSGNYRRITVDDISLITTADNARVNDVLKLFDASRFLYLPLAAFQGTTATDCAAEVVFFLTEHLDACYRAKWNASKGKYFYVNMLNPADKTWKLSQSSMSRRSAGTPSSPVPSSPRSASLHEFSEVPTTKPRALVSDGNAQHVLLMDMIIKDEGHQRMQCESEESIEWHWFVVDAAARDKILSLNRESRRLTTDELQARSHVAFESSLELVSLWERLREGALSIEAEARRRQGLLQEAVVAQHAHIRFEIESRKDVEIRWEEEHLKLLASFEKGASYVQHRALRRLGDELIAFKRDAMEECMSTAVTYQEAFRFLAWGRPSAYFDLLAERTELLEKYRHRRAVGARHNNGGGSETERLVDDNDMLAPGLLFSPTKVTSDTSVLAQRQMLAREERILQWKRAGEVTLPANNYYTGAELDNERGKKSNDALLSRKGSGVVSKMIDAQELLIHALPPSNSPQHQSWSALIELDQVVAPTALFLSPPNSVLHTLSEPCSPPPLSPVAEDENDITPRMLSSCIVPTPHENAMQRDFQSFRDGSTATGSRTIDQHRESLLQDMRPSAMIAATAPLQEALRYPPRRVSESLHSTNVDISPSLRAEDVAVHTSLRLPLHSPMRVLSTLSPKQIPTNPPLMMMGATPNHRSDAAPVTTSAKDVKGQWDFLLSRGVSFSADSSEATCRVAVPISRLNHTAPSAPLIPFPVSVEVASLLPCTRDVATNCLEWKHALHVSLSSKNRKCVEPFLCAVVVCASDRQVMPSGSPPRSGSALLSTVQNELRRGEACGETVVGGVVWHWRGVGTPHLSPTGFFEFHTEAAPGLPLTSFVDDLGRWFAEASSKSVDFGRLSTERRAALFDVSSVLSSLTAPEGNNNSNVYVASGIPIAPSLENKVTGSLNHAKFRAEVLTSCARDGGATVTIAGTEGAMIETGAIWRSLEPSVVTVASNDSPLAGSLLSFRRIVWFSQEDLSAQLS